MRAALRALTLRGRAFLAAGAAALVSAFVVGHAELVRVAALLVLLPLATAFFLARSRYRLGLVRTLSPTQVTAGQPATVQLDLSNDGRMPTGVLLLEDEVPYTLGSRPRFVIDRMSRGWHRSVDYTVRAQVRGRFAVGPMRVRLGDPFGLVELERAFTSTSSLVVTPQVVPLPVVPLSGAWTGTGDNRPQAFASGSAEDVMVREYRRGDDLRRVHWRSSAHAGELMVRREEQPWQSRATVFLDNRRFAHRGRGAGSSLEHAVTIAASVAVHLVQRGYMVRLVTADDQGRGGTWHEHGAVAAETAPLLESLAVLEESASGHLESAWLPDVGDAGVLVAVLGDIAGGDLPALTRMRHSASDGLAFVLDVPAWAGSRAPASHPIEQDTAWLAAHGWRSVAAGPSDPLPLLWQELAVASRATGPLRGAPSTAAAQQPGPFAAEGERRR